MDLIKIFNTVKEIVNTCLKTNTELNIVPIWKKQEEFKGIVFYKIELAKTIINSLKFNELYSEIKAIEMKFNENNKTFRLLLFIKYTVKDNDTIIDIVIRKIKLKEITPKRYLYHLTNKENRSSIFQKGLLPVDFKDSHWVNTPCLLYPDAVFANNIDFFPYFFSIDEWLYKPVCHKDIEIWRIDTNECSNIWYEDMNVSDSVMTFEKIPASSLKLFGINRDNIEAPNSLLIYGLMLEDYIYPIDAITGKAIIEPKEIIWPITPDEFMIESQINNTTNDYYFTSSKFISRVVAKNILRDYLRK